MKSIALGKTPLSSSRLAYGCWRIAGAPGRSAVTAAGRAQGRDAVKAAYDAGYRLFDHADIYCDGVGEEIFGEVLKEVSGMRADVLVASKCGIRKSGQRFGWSKEMHRRYGLPIPPGGAGVDAAKTPYRYDFRREYIIESCEGSLRRLGISTIDIYQLHRPDFLADPAEVAEAFSSLQKAGKVRYFGLSNCRPSFFALLQKFCPMPLVVHQVEIGLMKLEPFTDGTLDQCLMETVTPLAWSPLGGGKLFAEGPAQSKLAAAVTGRLSDLAAAHGATPAAVAVAWLLKHPAGIVPIIGSTKPERIKELASAAEIRLSHEEWYYLLEAARAERLP